MSNRIDIYQSENKSLSILAADVSVYVDGVVRDGIEVIEIVRSGSPDFSYAKLACHCPDHDIEAGSTVCISESFNSSPPSEIIDTLPIFVGQINSIDTNLSSKGSLHRITANDFSGQLQLTTLYGKRIAETSGSTRFLATADLIFNADAQPDAANELIKRNGFAHRFFASDLSTAVPWSYAEIIDYLLDEYTNNNELLKPPLEFLQSLTNNQLVAELDLTGINLLEALRDCCQQTGLSFKFIPVYLPTGPRQSIVFYKGSTGVQVELNLQQSGERINLSKTNVAAYKNQKGSSSVTHRYIGIGDVKIYEATFDLVKAWDPALESTNYDVYSPSTNPDFYQVRDVYRKWTLNESGEYTSLPYDQGSAYDLSKLLGTDNYLRQRRRFKPMLTTDNQGHSLGYYLQVTHDGENWQQYFDAFDILLDECGIWLSAERLDVPTWIAAMKGLLKFRITATILSDERLSCEVSDGPINSTAHVIDHVIQLPRPFRYQKVTNQSIFYGGSDSTMSNDIDDSVALYEYVRNRGQDNSEVIETVDLQTPYLAFHYNTGDLITTPSQSRDILNLQIDNRSTALIKHVYMDFKNQCTNLKIIRKRLPRL